MAKLALVIGVSDYKDGFDSLPAAIEDVKAIRQILRNPNISGFKVKALTNPGLVKMQLAIENFYAECNRDDLTLLYISCHGFKIIGGKYYLTTRQSRKNKQGKPLVSTAIPASFILDCMDESNSREQVVIIDGCYSGAFAKNMFAYAGGKKRVILTSSNSAQHSFMEAGTKLSIYTRCLVDGFKTIAADVDKDGALSAKDLHKYVSLEVGKVTRKMKIKMNPKIFAIDGGDDIRLAKAAIGYPGVVESFVTGGEISAFESGY